MSYEQVVWAWNQHLRAGGGVPWREWLRSTPAEEAGAHPPAGWVPPGAAQLEFVRRAALAGAVDAPRFGELADLVTGRSGPGRGLAQQPLWWPAQAAGQRFGAPQVDPSRVPAEELVRVGVGVLVELVLAAPDGPPPPVRRPRRPGRWRPTYEVVGAPVTTATLRRGLTEQGYAEGGRSPRVLVVAAPFDDLLAQIWSARVQRGAAVRWHGFVRRWAGRSRLPPSADLPALARSWAQLVGVDRVHVLVAAAGSHEPLRAATALLGGHGPTRRPHRAVEHAGKRAGQPAPATRDLSPAAVDVLRRVNAVLAVRVSPQRHRAVLPRLVDTLAEAPPSPGLTVPPPFQDWARGRAERVVEELRAGGYPVHGSLEGVVPRFEGLRTRPSRQDALAVVLEACLRHVR